MAKKNQQKQQKPKFSAVWIYVPLLFMLGYMYFFGENGGDPVKKEWFEVKEQMIPQGDVEKITFVANEKMAEVTIKKKTAFQSTRTCLEEGSPSSDPISSLRSQAILRLSSSLSRPGLPCLKTSAFL
jgi:hypothetical protein